MLQEHADKRQVLIRPSQTRRCIGSSGGPIVKKLSDMLVIFRSTSELQLISGFGGWVYALSTSLLGDRISLRHIGDSSIDGLDCFGRRNAMFIYDVPLESHFCKGPSL